MLRVQIIFINIEARNVNTRSTFSEFLALKR
jgi:hypothetical protein